MNDASRPFIHAVPARELVSLALGIAGETDARVADLPGEPRLANDPASPINGGPSKSLRQRHGHTPLSEAEDIPWSCRRLVIGTGVDGMLPVTEGVVREARRRGVQLFVVPTATAIKELEREPADTNAVLHVTC